MCTSIFVTGTFRGFLMIPLETIGERMFEWACRDGDYGPEAILRGTREQEKDST